MKRNSAFILVEIQFTMKNFKQIIRIRKQIKFAINI